MPKQPFTFKTCPVCGVKKPRSEYYKKGETVSHKCKPCHLADLKSRQDRYIGKYSEYVNQWRRDKYQDEQEFRDKIAEQKKARYEARKEEINAARRDRWASDPNSPARSHNRNSNVKRRTPSWVHMPEILRIYQQCPDGYEVDHIVPIKGLIDGRPVSGLHVPWNLQYLTPTANRKKKNKISESSLQLPPQLPT